MNPPASPAVLLTVAVCLKPTWRTDVPLRLAEEARGRSGSLLPDGAQPGGSALDAGVLARALALRAELAAAGAASRVLALSFGAKSSGAERILRDALAAGADEVLRVGGDEPGEAQDDTPQFDGSAGGTRAKALRVADALRARTQGGPLLVLTGDASPDEGHGVFGAFLAQALGCALAHRAVRLVTDGEGWKAAVKLERGYTQDLRLPRSAVVTLAATGLALPDAAWPAWLASRTATIPSMDPPSGADAEASAASGSATTTLRAPVPRVKHYTVPAATLTAEQRIRALVGTQAQGGGIVIPASEGVERQVDAILKLLQERGHLAEPR